MRAILVAGMMVAAAAAGAQEPGWKVAAEGLANAIAASKFCGFDVSQSAVEEHLKSAGFSRPNASHTAALDAEFQHQSNLWFVAAQSAATSPAQKQLLDANCQRILLGFGPDGLIRKGVLSKK